MSGVCKEKKSKRKLNKEEKEKKLYNAAYELFMESGIENTTVDQIVKKADVAKGTFYLYFKDKYDVIDKLILKKSYMVVEEALASTKEKNLKTFEEILLYFIDYIIQYFKENKLMLKVINKNFSWGLYRKGIKIEGLERVENIIDIFLNNIKERGIDEKEGRITLYMIIELVGSVCYNSIILEEPEDIEVIKPVLFKKIISMIK